MADEMVADPSKVCTRCGLLKSADDFYKGGPKKSCRLGLQTRCKVCQHVLTAEWRLKNAEALRAKRLAAYQADLESNRARGREKARANPAAVRAQRLRSYQKHRERRRAAVDAYNEANREKVQQQRRDYYARKIKGDPAKMLRLRARARFREGLKQAALSGTIGQTFEGLFGYTAAELLAHVVARFQPDMTMDDLLAGRIHIDHIRPVSSFSISGLDSPELKECWALSNLQPMWAKDNLSKGARLST